MKDDKLLALLKKDPNAGMQRLTAQYAGLVFAVVRGRLGDICDSSEIEDCVTDVFLHFQSGLRTFVPRASVKTYLAVIARNTAADYARNRIGARSIDDEDFSLEIPADGDFTEEVAKKALLEEIWREIRAMGPPDADILIRKYYLGQSSKAIAAALGMTVSNVDTRAHRAMEKLRSRFGGTV